MKQKKINDILYVFDITPYQITEDTDAQVIKVQEECVASFKELNESLADKIVAYNYHVACVNVPEWAPYVDQTDPEPPVVKNYTFTLYPGAERRKIIINFSDGQAYQATVDESHMPGMNDPINIEGYGEYEGYVYTYAVPENIEITLQPLYDIKNYTYDTKAYSYDSETRLLTPSIIMDTDKAVYCVYVEPSTYTFKLEGYDIQNNCEITVNNEGVSYTVEELVDGVQLNDGDVIDVRPTGNPEDYTLISGATWDLDHWTATVNGADVTIVINYTAPKNNEEQPE